MQLDKWQWLLKFYQIRLRIIKKINKKKENNHLIMPFNCLYEWRNDNGLVHLPNNCTDSQKQFYVFFELPFHISIIIYSFAFISNKKGIILFDFSGPEIIWIKVL